MYMITTYVDRSSYFLYSLQILHNKLQLYGMVKQKISIYM